MDDFITNLKLVYIGKRYRPSGHYLFGFMDVTTLPRNIDGEMLMESSALHFFTVPIKEGLRIGEVILIQATITHDDQFLLDQTDRPTIYKWPDTEMVAMWEAYHEADRIKWEKREEEKQP